MNLERLKELAKEFTAVGPDNVDYDDERECEEYTYLLRVPEARYCGVKEGSTLTHIFNESQEDDHWEFSEPNGEIVILW